jgi:hypothetical protein
MVVKVQISLIFMVSLLDGFGVRWSSAATHPRPPAPSVPPTQGVERGHLGESTRGLGGAEHKAPAMTLWHALVDDSEQALLEVAFLGGNGGDST